MPYYFVGGEDHDFAKIGVTSVNTATTAARRTAYARCTLQVGGSSAATDGFQAPFTTTATSFWITGRWYGFGSISGTNTFDFLALLDGATRRLMVHMDGASHLRISKQNAVGTRTTLATSSLSLALTTQYKIDVQVISYGATATVNVYQDNVLWVTFTGDVTTDSSASLSGFVLGNTGTVGAAGTNWSEIIAGTADTRALSLCTLPPAANGNAFAWTGSYAGLNEVTLDDATLSTSATANELLQTTITSSGITGTPAIRAVCVSARAQKGGSGPQNVQMNVRTGANDYFSGTLALPAALARVANIFETNPATSGAWAYTDLTAAGFNVGAKSIA